MGKPPPPFKNPKYKRIEITNVIGGSRGRGGLITPPFDKLCKNKSISLKQIVYNSQVQGQMK